MRPRRSTVVVFAVVASVWFAVSLSVLGSAYWYDIIRYGNNYMDAPGHVQWVSDASEALAFMAFPFNVLFSPLVGMTLRLIGGESATTEMLAVILVLAASSLAWSAAITSVARFVRSDIGREQRRHLTRANAVVALLLASWWMILSLTLSMTMIPLMAAARSVDASQTVGAVLLWSWALSQWSLNAPLSLMAESVYSGYFPSPRPMDLLPLAVNALFWGVLISGLRSVVRRRRARSNARSEA